MTQATLAQASLVPDHERLAFLPKHFGTRLMLRGEISVYNWLDRLAQDYRGGYWHYYEIPNGFYMAPAGYDTQVRSSVARVQASGPGAHLCPRHKGFSGL